MSQVIFLLYIIILYIFSKIYLLILLIRKATIFEIILNGNIYLI